MPHLNKRQAQIKRLANAKRKLSITTKLNTETKRTRILTSESDLLQQAGDMTDPQSSELSYSDDSSSVQSSSEDSSNELTTDGPGSQLPEAIINRRVCDELKWHAGAEKGSGLRNSYSGSSKSTIKRRRRDQRELERASANTHNILSLFKKQQKKNDEEQNITPTSLAVEQESPSDSEESKRQLAVEELEKLLKSTREQAKKYGRMLPATSDFYRRHLMVRSFLYLQQQKDKLQLSRRRDIAAIVAANFKRGINTGRKIIQWEREWMRHRRIPESRAGKHSACLSWLADEGVLCAVREFAVSQGEGKCWMKRLMTSSLITNLI